MKKYALLVFHALALFSCIKIALNMDILHRLQSKDGKMLQYWITLNPESKAKIMP